MTSVTVAMVIMVLKVTSMPEFLYRDYIKIMPRWALS